MQKEIENLEFIQCVNFEFTDLLKNNGTKHLLILAVHVERYAIQKRLLILLLLEDIVGWVHFTLRYLATSR